MIATIKFLVAEFRQWRDERAAAAEHRQWDKGYDYAAGALLREADTSDLLDEVDTCCEHHISFARGMNAAVVDWIAKGHTR